MAMQRKDKQSFFFFNGKFNNTRKCFIAHKIYFFITPFKGAS